MLLSQYYEVFKPQLTSTTNKDSPSKRDLEGLKTSIMALQAGDWQGMKPMLQILGQYRAKAIKDAGLLGVKSFKDHLWARMRATA
jgi:hypothetical protein